MKKMLLSAAFLAAMTSVSAQKLTYVPYADLTSSLKKHVFYN